MASHTSKALSQALRQTTGRGLPSTHQHICASCRIALSTPAPLQAPTRARPTQRAFAPHPSRPFSSTSRAAKKSSSNPKSPRKAASLSGLKQDSNPPVPDNKHTRNLDSEPDPYDHSQLQTAIDAALARLKDALAKTRDAGRISTAMLEELPVELNVKGAGAPHKQRQRVGDLASVVPRGGRTLQVYVGAEAHVKAVAAAVQASPYSLVPAADAQNPLVLVVPVPPATGETRAQAAAEAKRCFDRASLDVRTARGDAQKRHKRMEQDKVVVPDELRKAHKGMEEVARNGQDEAKRVYDAAVKALQNA